MICLESVWCFWRGGLVVLHSVLLLLVTGLHSQWKHDRYYLFSIPT